MLEHFWKVWQSEYKKELPKSQHLVTWNALSVGSVVLIREKSLPKLQWPLDIVSKVVHGKGGLVRTVELKTSKGSFYGSEIVRIVKDTDNESADPVLSVGLLKNPLEDRSLVMLKNQLKFSLDMVGLEKHLKI